MLNPIFLGFTSRKHTCCLIQYFIQYYIIYNIQNNTLHTRILIGDINSIKILQPRKKKYSLNVNVHKGTS